MQLELHEEEEEGGLRQRSEYRGVSWRQSPGLSVMGAGEDRMPAGVDSTRSG